MKLKFQSFYRLLIFALLLLLFWACWVEAQPVFTTNNPAPPAPAGLQPSSLAFRLDTIPALQRKFFEIPLWQYLASLIFIILAFFAAKLLDHLICLALKGWARRTKTLLDDLFFQLIGWPIKLIVFVILIHIGLNVFLWPIWFKQFFSKGLKIAVAISITYSLLRLSDVLMGHWQKTARQGTDRSHEQILPIIRNAARVFIILVAVLFTLQNLDINISSLLASLSIGGLALGLAAQDTLANLFGAVAVLVDKPFRVGDRIRVDQIEGVVEELGFRSTRVRNADGYLVTIPNKTVGNAVITNIARRPSIRTVMNLALAYDLPAEKIERAVEILKEVYGRHPMTQEFTAAFNRFTEAAINLELVHLWKSLDHHAYLAGIQEMNLELKRRFDQEQIRFAIPPPPVSRAPTVPPPS